MLTGLGKYRESCVQHLIHPRSLRHCPMGYEYGPMVLAEKVEWSPMCFELLVLRILEAVMTESCQQCEQNRISHALNLYDHHKCGVSSSGTFVLASRPYQDDIEKREPANLKIQESPRFTLRVVD